MLDILFNHWITQKENYNRLSSTIKRGEFEISRNIVMVEFGIKETKAKNLIKRFVDDEIIKLKKRGNSSSKKSVYVYLSVLEDVKKTHEKKTKLETKLETKQRPSELLENQYIQGCREPSKDHVKNQANTHSKKELIKKNYKKDIYASQCDALWKLYPKKKGKQDAYKKIPKLLEKYGCDQIERCIERYKLEIDINKTDMQYVKEGKTFFNSGYVDYLDENYQERQIQEKPKVKIGESKIDFSNMTPEQLMAYGRGEQ